MPIVVFDLDGTLVDQARAARLWAEEFVVEWALPDTVVDRVSAELTQRTSKDGLFEKLVSDLSLPISAGELWGAYRRRMPDLVRCTEEDKDALRKLRQAGWTLGIASNGATDNQEGKIRNTGLADLVDGWVISAEIGYRKPDPEIFQALARHLDCALDGWMIGDSLEHDVAGGSAAGLRTAWISPLQPSSPASEVRPTLIAPTVAEAAMMILSVGH
jgi:HAD superfamily hydrolase (TIGR01549 family)